MSNASSQLMDFINENPALVKQYLSTMNPVDWANESFQYVRSTVYNYTLGPDNVPALGDDYYYHNLPIVKERLAAAGVRLAKLLNNIFTGQINIDWKKILPSVRIIN
jgi:hypothetical protein